MSGADGIDGVCMEQSGRVASERPAGDSGERRSTARRGANMRGAQTPRMRGSREARGPRPAAPRPGPVADEATEGLGVSRLGHRSLPSYDTVAEGVTTARCGAPFARTRQGSMFDAERETISRMLEMCEATAIELAELARSR